MNFFDKLKAQVNMNDGGKTWSNPQGNTPQAPLNLRDAQGAMMQGALVGGVPGLQSGGRFAQDSGLQMAQPSPYGQQNLGPAVTFEGMQEAGPRYEDDYTATAALEQTGYINPQTTQYGYKQQDGRPGSPLQANNRALQDDYLRRLLGN